ncbi:MAG: rhomboid family intramembrane serine protease, partial [Saprospiraceae bacterium]
MFRTRQPSLGIVLHLIIINALMYIGSFAVLGQELWDPRTREMAELGRLKLAAFMPGSQHFEPYQILTHMFMHGNLMHLLFNMMALFFFGPAIEMVWGWRRVFFFFFFLGVGGYGIGFWGGGLG